MIKRLRKREERGEEGAQKGRDPKRHASLKAAFRRIWWVIPILLALNVYFGSRVSDDGKPVTVPYTLFREQVEAQNVREVSAAADEIEGRFREPVVHPPGGAGTTEFQTRRPALGGDGLLPLLVRNHVEITAQPPRPERPVWQVLLVSIAPTLLLVSVLVLIMRKTVGSGGVLGGLGRSKAQRYHASSEGTRFDEVAGIDEAKEELIEIVDFLRDPGRYSKLGAAIPKGVLLSGQPGTGKTLLARAVAGEAGVPFYSLSASEFVEMVAGVGASRVRDLFAKAKENAPAIVFVDELDAIGRARGGGAGSAAALDEREQTLNQILTEMDGFSGSEGVIVIAATNRPEILDAALLRPGRFDRRVVVSPPDRAGRVAILQVHTRGVPLAPDADVRRIAARTPGMVGADLKNLVNEAALVAARKNESAVTLVHFNEALEKIVLGAERRITISADERLRTAYHEAGHALLGMIEPGVDPVRKVTIVPRGRALGVTLSSPMTDRYGYTTGDLRGRIVVALGGRASEQLVFGTVTTGAESDLEYVTELARHMIGRWGMSEAVGLVSVLPAKPDGWTLAGPNGTVSEATRELVDDEVRRVISECYGTAREKLARERPRLESLARALLDNETLDEEDAYAAAGFEWALDEDGGSPSASANGQLAHQRHATRPPSLLD